MADLPEWLISAVVILISISAFAQGLALSSALHLNAVFLSPFAPHKAEGRRILEMEVISKTVVQVDICGHPTLKLCIRTQHEQGHVSDYGCIYGARSVSPKHRSTCMCWGHCMSVG